MKERIKEFKAFHEAKLLEKKTIGSRGSNDALQMDGSTVWEVHTVEHAEECSRREESACDSTKLAQDVCEMEIKEEKVCWKRKLVSDFERLPVFRPSQVEVLHVN